MKPGPNNKNTVVLSINELQRIKDSCSMMSATKNTFDKTQERMTLHAQSQQRVKNWPNTIQAMRKKKDEGRIKRLEEEEISRRKIEAEEEALQMELRNKTITAANKAIYESQDRVKAFKSKMMVCDMIEERQQQDKLRKRKQKMAQTIEKQWEELEKQQLAEQDEKTKAALEREYKQKMKNTEEVNKQMDDFKMNYIKKMQEDMLEGELLKRQVEEDVERERQKELDRIIRGKQLQEDQRLANDKLKEISEQMRQKELEEERKIEEFGKKKERLDQLKKDKEQQKFKDKQAERQRLIDRQIEYLNNKVSTEDRILNKQVNEAEEKAARLFEEQEKRKEAMKLAIERSRHQQIVRKKGEKDSEKREEEEFKEYWKIRNQELQEAEALEKEEERLRSKELADFLKFQEDQKRRIAEDEFRREQKNATKAQALLDQQEKHFYSYAEQAIQEWRGEGKNVTPLILELKSQAKQSQKLS
jgi:hypothetical protein